MSLMRYYPNHPARWTLNAHNAGCNSGEGSAQNWVPRTDVVEKDTAFEVSVELPGFDRENVKVVAENDLLTVSAEAAEESAEENADESGRYHRRERRLGAVKRSFRLPDGVDAGDIGATFKSGVLTVSVPKVPEVAPRTIEIAD